jgi:hypothetical protein
MGGATAVLTAMPISTPRNRTPKNASIHEKKSSWAEVGRGGNKMYIYMVCTACGACRQNLCYTNVFGVEDNVSMYTYIYIYLYNINVSSTFDKHLLYVNWCIYVCVSVHVIYVYGMCVHVCIYLSIFTHI